MHSDDVFMMPSYEEIESIGNSNKHARLSSSDSINLYHESVSTFELLTKEQEVLLARTIETGNALLEEINNNRNIATDHQKMVISTAMLAKERFIQCNLRLVASIASKYKSNLGNLDYLDLIQEGNLGLEHAVTKFDWRKGFKFSTYASWWIKQHIERAINNKSTTIRIPGDNYAQYRREYQEHSTKGKPFSSNSLLIARALEIDSLDESVYEESTTTLLDLVPGNDELETIYDRRNLHKIITYVLQDDPVVMRDMCDYFGFNESGENKLLKDIALEHGITSQAMSHRIMRALGRIRSYMNEYNLTMDDFC